MAVFHPPASSTEEMNKALAELSAKKDAWLAVSVKERLAILDVIARNLNPVAERWVHFSAEAKGYGAGHAVEGDEWAMFAGVPGNILRLKEVLNDVMEHGQPKLPNGFVTRNGQLTVQTFPLQSWEKAIFANYRADLWLEPGVSEAEALASQARLYKDKQLRGTLTLVLGAGNVSMLVPCDITSKLFLENQVVLLKMNPVNDYLGPLIEEAYRPLIERGFLVMKVATPDELSQLLIGHLSVPKPPRMRSQDQVLAILLSNWKQKGAALLLVMVSWLLLAGQQDFETGLSLPVELKNLPEQMDIAEPQSLSLRIRVRGLRKDASTLTKNNVHVELDLSAAGKGKRTVIISRDQISLPNDRVQVASIDPSQVTFKFREKSRT